MAWSDLEAEVALERDLLSRALPLTATSSDGTAAVTIDMASNRAHFSISVSETLGPSPQGCVDLLRIRPLMVGAAWKVLDLLLERALEEASVAPDRRSGFSIKLKVHHAQKDLEGPNYITHQAWSAILKTYVATQDMRHSLIHRRVYVDDSDALVGVGQNGQALVPLTSTQQEAFVRAVLRGTHLATVGAADPRVHADLVRQLGMLTELHGEQLPSVTLADSLPEITVIIDPERPGSNRYVLDLAALRRRELFADSTHADLVVHFRNRPGQELRGRLEECPEGAVLIDPDDPPGWLR